MTGGHIVSHILNLSTRWGDEWSTLCLGCFTIMERAPGTHWTGGWVGPRAGLDVVVMRRNPAPARIEH